MTQLLQRAFEKAAALPEDDQDFLAEMILDEIAQDQTFDAKIEATAHLLKPLADQARADELAGLNIDLDEVLDAIEDEPRFSQMPERASTTGAVASAA